MLPLINIGAINDFPFIAEDFDALTTYGLICKVAKSLNDTIKQVNKNTNWINNYVDEFDEIKAQISALNQIVNNHTVSINDIYNRLTTLSETVTNNYNTLKNYIDVNVANLQYQIDNFAIDNIRIYDPTTGLYSSIQTVINNMYGIINVNGITAGEFDMLELTASEFDAFDITAYQFDSNSKNILVI